MNDKINVLWAEFLVYSSGKPMHDHQHDFFHCIYVVEGSGYIQLDEMKYKLIPGCFYIAGPGTSHSFGADKNVALMLMEIKFEINDTAMLKKLDTFPDVISVEQTPVYTILKRIRTELTEKEELFSEIAALNLAEVLTLAERCSIAQSVKSAGRKEEPGNELVKIIAYIHDNLDREITLQELADKMCLEKSYFLKKFKKKYRCTPIKYTKILKMEKAKELLVHSDKNITQIADALGFKSVHHFSSQFTKMVGMSPKTYMKGK